MLNDCINKFTSFAFTNMSAISFDKVFYIIKSSEIY